MFVKICGTTNLADAELAVELGAAALGFIFAPSKRRVTVEEAAAITRSMSKYVDRVGVFTEPDAAEIGRTVRQAGLSAVQMHWPYDPAVVDAMRAAVGDRVALWQVVGFEVDAEDRGAVDEALTTMLRATLSDEQVDVVLLDSVSNGASGGLGVAVPWERAERVLQDAYRGATVSKEPRIVIAGGLRAENVGEAMQALRPWGVDVVSGVEERPGKKSPERLRAFLNVVRGSAGGSGQ